jgi:hypothetical protein
MIGESRKKKRVAVQSLGSNTSVIGRSPKGKASPKFFLNKRSVVYI